jgi:hypothetical protein
MRLLTTIVLALCGLHANVYAQPQATNPRSLYDSHRWFELRTLASERQVDLFYRAAVEMAFHQDERAEEDLNRYIATQPATEMRLEARELLLGAAFRSGRYQDALFQAQQILALKPDAPDIANFLPTLQVLAPFARQTIVSRQPSSLKIELLDQNLVLPVTIGEAAGNYILDNGFSLSGMSESEAKRLNLTVNTVATRIDTMSGAPVTVRIAIVPDLILGGLRLRNVAFYVLPDDQPPFNQLPPGHRGILGLQVVLALGHFAWQPKSATFTIYGNISSGPAHEPNLAFDGSSIFARLTFRGRPVDTSLDSGAQNTIFYPAFVRQFPDIEKDGVIEQHRVTGVGGSASMKSLTLPSLDFQLGGRSVILKPATVLLEDNNSASNRFQGNLGMSLLNQADGVEIDFGSMTLTLK